MTRQENGTWAVTASGVDHVLEHGGPAPDAAYLLKPGE